MRPHTTAAQQAHRVLSLAALAAVAITLFLVGLAAFKDPQRQAIAKPTSAKQAVRVPDGDGAASGRLGEPLAVGDESDTAVRRVFQAVLGLLAIAAVMFGLAAFGGAPATFLRLTAGLAALSALSAVLVLMRDVAVSLAAFQVLAVTATLAVAARIVGRHSLLDSPWRGARASAAWPEARTRGTRIEG
jgi:hypothetical protein